MLMFICEFCSKECNGKVGLGRHRTVCNLNPNGKIPNRQGIPAWNSGLRDDPRCKVNDGIAENLRNMTRNRSLEWHKENGKRISTTINQKVTDGTWHTSLAKRMHINYNGIDLHGSWEVAYAKFLDNNNIKWQRNKDSFTYTFQDKERKYTPDFYLIDDDVYIEIKGYKTEKDDAKWAQFPTHRKLIVLMQKDLVEMKVI